MTAFDRGPGFAISVAQAAVRYPVSAWFDASPAGCGVEAQLAALAGQHEQPIPRFPFFEHLARVESARRRWREQGGGQ